MADTQTEKDTWWLHEPYKSKLKEALAWAKKNPPAETDLDALFARVKPDTKGSASRGATRAKRAPPAKSGSRKK
jgi:hypothetical protein